MTQTWPGCLNVDYFFLDQSILVSWRDFDKHRAYMAFTSWRWLCYKSLIWTPSYPLWFKILWKSWKKFLIRNLLRLFCLDSVSYLTRLSLLYVYTKIGVFFSFESYLQNSMTFWQTIIGKMPFCKLEKGNCVTQLSCRNFHSNASPGLDSGETPAWNRHGTAMTLMWHSHDTGVILARHRCDSNEKCNMP
jgi:hypothetical protein